jgi:hypothetical protein
VATTTQLIPHCQLARIALENVTASTPFPAVAKHAVSVATLNLLLAHAHMHPRAMEPALNALLELPYYVKQRRFKKF